MSTSYACAHGYTEEGVRWALPVVPARQLAAYFDDKFINIGSFLLFIVPCSWQQVWKGGKSDLGNL